MYQFGKVEVQVYPDKSKFPEKGNLSVYYVDYGNQKVYGWLNGYIWIYNDHDILKQTDETINKMTRSEFLDWSGEEKIINHNIEINEHTEIII